MLAASSLAGAFTVTVRLAIQGHARAAQYRHMLDDTYQHAFTELTTTTGELDVALRKVTYATSLKLFSALCAQAYGKAPAAQSALGELPYGNVELEQTTTFLAKTGDHAMTLARDAYGETACTETHRETLRGLTRAASTLFGALQSLLTELDTDTIRPENVETVQVRLSNATESGEPPAGLTFQTVEADFPEIPVLIYDGPFSDHLSGRTSRMLEGPPQISEAEVHRVVMAFLGLREDIFTLNTQGEERLPTWDFSALVNDGELYVEVTRQDDQVLQVLSPRLVDEASLSAQKEWQKAAEFLSERDYQDMNPSYSIQQGGILTVHFASRQDGVYYYSGLVKVGVALDTGDMVSFESEDYLMSHGDRTLPTSIVSETGAAAQMDGSLTVLTHRLTLIPTGGEYEALCHKFKCQSTSGGHMLVYVDVADDRQEHILLLQEDENGTLVV